MKGFLYLVLVAVAMMIVGCSDDSTGVKTVEYNEESCRKNIVKTVINTNAVGFESIFDKYFPTEEERAEFLQSYVDSAKYFEDNSGYFFIEDMEANMVAHGLKKELVGQNRMDVQDVKGKFYVREMMDSLNSKGSGFVEFYFTNPTTNEEEQKLAYVQVVKNHDYFIGSGFYNPDDKTKVSVLDHNKRLITAATHTVVKGMGEVFRKEIVAESAWNAFLTEFVSKIRFFGTRAVTSLFTMWMEHVWHILCSRI